MGGVFVSRERKREVHLANQKCVWFLIICKKIEEEAEVDLNEDSPYNKVIIGGYLHLSIAQNVGCLGNALCSRLRHHH